MIVNRFHSLLKAKSAKEIKTLSIPAVSKATGLSTSLLYAWIDPQGIQRYDAQVIEKLCIYLGCTVGQLLVRVK